MTKSFAYFTNSECLLCNSQRGPWFSIKYNQSFLKYFNQITHVIFVTKQKEVFIFPENLVKRLCCHANHMAFGVHIDTNTTFHDDVEAVCTRPS